MRPTVNTINTRWVLPAYVFDTNLIFQLLAEVNHELAWLSNAHKVFPSLQA